MNPSQNPARKFPFGSGPNAMNNRTLYATLAVSAAAAFVFTLLLYAWLSGRNPVSRLGYGIFVSVLPAVGALIVLKLTNVFVTWRGAAIVYFALFVLVVIFLILGR